MRCGEELPGHVGLIELAPAVARFRDHIWSFSIVGAITEARLVFLGQDHTHALRKRSLSARALLP